MTPCCYIPPLLSTAMILDNHPLYLLEPQAASNLEKELVSLQERVELLREHGTLSDETLRSYYGEKRFEQVAESNAIEGSTLDVGETKLAMLKGTTLTGHDPAYVRDAIALGKAIERLEEMARGKEPTSLEELLELHRILFGERPGGGEVRNEPVALSGSAHRPPETRQEVRVWLTKWQQWSLDHRDAPPLIRATVLHAWLTWIHPFVDGNGRSARAITTLELVRAGYPPLIIRRNKDRDRYIDALRASDDAGDLGPLFQLFIEREHDALRDLERTAKRWQGYDAVAERIRKAQAQRLRVFLTSIELLVEMLQLELDRILEGVGGEVRVVRYDDAVSVEDFIALCERSSAGNNWGFRVELQAPAVAPLHRLAWIGYRSSEMDAQVKADARGPSLFWSVPNPEKYPPWVAAGDRSPAYAELGTHADRGDVWIVRDLEGCVREERPSDVARRLAQALSEQLLEAVD